MTKKNKCKGSGFSSINIDMIEEGRFVCRHCHKSLKVRMNEGGHDGHVNGRPKTFTVPTHKS